MPLLTLLQHPNLLRTRILPLIQRNTLRNWLALGDEVEVVVIGDEPGIAEVCREFGIRYIPGCPVHEKGNAADQFDL